MLVFLLLYGCEYTKIRYAVCLIFQFGENNSDQLFIIKLITESNRETPRKYVFRVSQQSDFTYCVKFGSYYGK